MTLVNIRVTEINNNTICTSGEDAREEEQGKDWKNDAQKKGRSHD